MPATYFYSSVAVPNSIVSTINGAATTCTLATTPTGYPASYPFKVVLDPDTPSEEIVYVTNITGVTVTMERGKEGTSAVEHVGGAVFRHRMTGKDLQDSRDHEAATVAHGATGAVMGTTNTQTPTNKTWDGGTNTFQNVPQSAITSLVADLAAKFASASFGTNWLTTVQAALGSNWATALGAALGGNWTTALAAALGSNWATALAAALGTNWTTALAAALGSGWTARLAAQAPIFKFKATNETVNNSAVMQNDDDLFASLPAGDWQFELMVTWAAATAADFKWEMILDGGAYTFSEGQFFSNRDSAATPPFTAGQFDLADVLAIAANGVGSRMGMSIIGMVKVTSLGTLRFRWAQNTANASDANVYQGSYLKVTPLTA